MKVKLDIEYDGEAFSGWQSQPSGQTVQDELDRALAVYLGSLAAKSGVELSTFPHLKASGRTDAGVHARAQVVSFLWPSGLEFDGCRLVSSLNGITKPGVSICSASEMGDDFDARFSSHLKCYSYYILNRRGRACIDAGRVWHVSAELDIAAMISAAKCFVGTHDFSAFQAADCGAKSSVRSIFLSEISRQDKFTLAYSIVGSGFLKQMVRCIVGTLAAVGRGRCSRPADRTSIRERRSQSRRRKLHPAAVCFLEWVRYTE